MLFVRTIASSWAPLEQALRMAGMPRCAMTIARWAFYAGCAETLAQLSHPDAAATRENMLAELREDGSLLHRIEAVAHDRPQQG
jgi:hypothetical protein